MTGIVIRLAIADDAAGINAVYNPFIEQSTATFETEPYDLVKREAWLSRLRATGFHPVFVAICDNNVVGFANAAPFDDRPAYSLSVKTTVFVHPDFSGQGIGQRLYAALTAAIEKTEIHRVYALIVAPNDASTALHQRFGYRHIVTLREVGRKFDRFLDVMWFEKQM